MVALLGAAQSSFMGSRAYAGSGFTVRILEKKFVKRQKSVERDLREETDEGLAKKYDEKIGTLFELNPGLTRTLGVYEDDTIRTKLKVLYSDQTREFLFSDRFGLTHERAHDPVRGCRMSPATYVFLLIFLMPLWLLFALVCKVDRKKSLTNEWKEEFTYSIQ